MNEFWMNVLCTWSFCKWIPERKTSKKDSQNSVEPIYLRTTTKAQTMVLKENLDLYCMPNCPSHKKELKGSNMVLNQ